MKVWIVEFEDTCCDKLAFSSAEKAFQGVQQCIWEDFPSEDDKDYRDPGVPRSRAAEGRLRGRACPRDRCG